mgnify:CR=1 FL=1
MDAGFSIMDLPDDAIGKIVDKWDVSDYVPFDPSHVQMNVSDGDNGDDDETREAKRAQLLVIKKAQYEALTEATIHENAQALNAFRATCSKFCDEYRAKARALQIKLWIQKGPAVAGGGRLRLRPGVANSGGAALTLNSKTSIDNRAVHDYVYLDFDNAKLERKESCVYKPEWTSMYDAVFTYSNRLLFNLSTSKHDIVRELKCMIGRKIHSDGDGVEDEFHSLFKGYGLAKASIKEFDVELRHRAATTHRGYYFDQGHDTQTDIAYTVRFHAKFKLPGGDTFGAIGKMTPAYPDAFDTNGHNHNINPMLWRHAMEKRLKKTDAMPPVLHLVTYERIGIIPKWLELERAVKAKVEHQDDQQSELAKEELRKRRRMDDTVVMTRFEKAVLRHKAAKYDNGGASKAPAADSRWYEQFQDGRNAHQRAHELETSVAQLTSRAEAAEKACNALQARLDQANEKLGKRANVHFKQDMREARAEGRGHEVGWYAWAEQFNPERRGC